MFHPFFGYLPCLFRVLTVLSEAWAHANSISIAMVSTATKQVSYRLKSYTYTSSSRNCPVSILICRLSTRFDAPVFHSSRGQACLWPSARLEPGPFSFEARCWPKGWRWLLHRSHIHTLCLPGCGSRHIHTGHPQSGQRRVMGCCAFVRNQMRLQRRRVRPWCMRGADSTRGTEACQLCSLHPAAIRSTHHEGLSLFACEGQGGRRDGRASRRLTVATRVTERPRAPSPARKKSGSNR